jgi:hypothetical protein
MRHHVAGENAIGRAGGAGRLRGWELKVHRDRRFKPRKRPTDMPCADRRFVNMPASEFGAEVLSRRGSTVAPATPWTRSLSPSFSLEPESPMAPIPRAWFVARSERPERELDSPRNSLWAQPMEEVQRKTAVVKPDPIQALRELTLSSLIPIFVDLIEKYSPTGFCMHMDASNFLEGGREIKFEFGFGEFRTQLAGTVTDDAIAFHETRYTPDIHGKLVSGPMLRLKNLTGENFRDFICERLTTLLQTASRRR